METAKLKKFAQFARRSLMEQVSAKLKLVLAGDSAARRESPTAIKNLDEAIQKTGKTLVIERVAYIWFNRFCALRFMDVNRYTRIGVVSPAEGQFQPEILAEAKMGHIDDEMVHDKVRQQIFALLDGKTPSRDPQGEAYRQLVVAACNFWNKAMPFLFQRIDDYTELLMPDDLLSGNSILAYTREAMTPDTCEDVEVIGWLYQFYISEKKDEVFDGLKKNKKITPENIPAATQLFTPHWIVRYLVENSLGRLWLLNRPGSKLALQMDYYIRPEQAEADFQRISKPEEIKICDPACGSGHMLTCAFDLLYAIYEEESYEPAEIPEKILTHNLYGIEIDERAGELAAFALIMKAAAKFKGAKQRRFFNKGVKPKICVLENVHFDEGELKNYMDFVGRDLFTAPLQATLRQFEEADNFGSLIRPELTDVAWVRKTLEEKNVSGQLFLTLTHQKVLQALLQADYLSPKYHVVIANPPYMGSKGMNGRLKSFMAKEFSEVKSDLFSAFVVRIIELAKQLTFVGMMTPFNWMFLSAFERLRNYIITRSTITSLVRPEFHAFFDSAYVSICAFTLHMSPDEVRKAPYIDLKRFYGADLQPKKFLEAIKNPDCGWLYYASISEFRKIPGFPIVYWIGVNATALFDRDNMASKYQVGSGLSTSDNERFVRYIWEVSRCDVAEKVTSCEESANRNERWYLFQKGGEFRKWYGNLSHVVNWRKNGVEIKHWVMNNPKDPDTTHWSRRIFNTELYFKEGLTWSTISSGKISFRLSAAGTMISNAAGGIFGFKSRSELLDVSLGLNNNIWMTLIGVLNPTLNYSAGIIQKTPIPDFSLGKNGETLLNFAKYDWDSCETSWGFSGLPLLNLEYRQPTLKATYLKLRAHWVEMTMEMQRLEEENNRIFIKAYGLQDELTPEVPLNEITLTCNPRYRYGSDKSEEELEALLLADTMRELVSYAVGCMFGRYALDRPGLILANQGETIEDYLKRVPEPSFPSEDDNVIPMLDGDWFADDIADRFRKFLRVAFGEEHYEENLQFVEQALNIKGKRSYSIRNYFLGEFYNDHVKLYKKRPIYWLFSSPKGSFNALIYVHRYRPDTVSVVLNDYLREFKTKIAAHQNHLEAVSISASARSAEKTAAIKEIEKLKKTLVELDEWEREVLYPLAARRIEIDLDDGVNVNYAKLGAALKRVHGLSE
jgi:type II restriction/modification system DNA methylase subunit YeeA